MNPIDNKARLAHLTALINRRNEAIREAASIELTTAFNAWLRTPSGAVGRTQTNYTQWAASDAHICFPLANRCHPIVVTNVSNTARSLGYAVKTADDGTLSVSVQGDLPAEMAPEASVFTTTVPSDGGRTLHPMPAFTDVASVIGPAGSPTVASVLTNGPAIGSVIATVTTTPVVEGQKPTVETLRVTPTGGDRITVAPTGGVNSGQTVTVTVPAISTTGFSDDMIPTPTGTPPNEAEKD